MEPHERALISRALHWYVDTLEATLDRQGGDPDPDTATEVAEAFTVLRKLGELK